MTPENFLNDIEFIARTFSVINRKEYNGKYKYYK